MKDGEYVGFGCYVGVAPAGAERKSIYDPTNRRTDKLNNRQTTQSERATFVQPSRADKHVSVQKQKVAQTKRLGYSLGLFVKGLKRR